MFVVGATFEDGGCRFVAAGRNCSPRELRRDVLVKLVGLLVLTSDLELFMFSLLKYAESVPPADVPVAVVFPGTSDSLCCCLSFEWKGFESRHFERFSLSVAVVLLEGIAAEGGSTMLASSGGTAGVSC
jgi:hypothetical protein